MLTQYKLDAGLIRKVATGEYSEGWTSRSSTVEKKDGTARHVLDLSGQRTYTTLSPCQVKLEVDDFEELRRHQAFFVLDWTQAYNQLRVREEDRCMFRYFSLEGDMYELLGTPQGQPDSVCQFTMATRVILGEIPLEPFEGLRMYIDDNVGGASGSTFGQAMDRSLDLLEKTLKVLAKRNVTLHPKKVALGQKSVVFRGRKIEAGKVQMSDERRAAFAALPIPTTAGSVWTFLGAINWWDHYIPQLKSTARPLIELMKGILGKLPSKNRTMRGTSRLDVRRHGWGEVHDTAFRSTVSAIQAALVRHTYTEGDDLHFFSDASDFGGGAHEMNIWVEVPGTDICISLCSSTPREQRGRPIEERDHKPLDMASWTWSQPIGKLAILEKEVFALIKGLETFKGALLGRHVHIWCDNKAAVAIFAPSRVLESRMKAAKIMRWLAPLARMSFDIMWLPSETNKMADYLSRNMAVPTGEYIAFRICL